MPNVYLFRADSTGTDSIQSYIDDGSIIDIPCPTFAAFDDAARRLQDSIKPGEGVIFDTISSLLETTRGDMMLGSDAKESLWDQHAKFFGDKQTLNTYRGAQNLTLRRIKNLAARKAYCIINAHETEGKDEPNTIKRAVPLVNPAMVDDLIAACSDVARLVVLTSNQADRDGNVIAESGSRILYLRRTDEHTAKFHVDPRRRDPKKIPEGIIEPTMTKLADVYGKIPSVLCCYGHPGSGKSTLAASLVELLNVKGQE